MYATCMLLLRQVRYPRKFLHEALTWEQSAKLMNEALWQSGLRDRNHEAGKTEKIDDITDEDEVREANKYLENPIMR